MRKNVLVSASILIVMMLFGESLLNILPAGVLNLGTMPDTVFAADESDLTLEVNRTDEVNKQVLTSKVTTEDGKNILTIVHDYWSETGAADGTLADKSDLSITFTTSQLATAERTDGVKLSETRDFSEPFEVKVAAKDDPNMSKLYEVRAEILVTPIRISGLNDATGTLGMKFFADPEVFADDDGMYYIYPTTDGHSHWQGWQIRCFASEDLVTWEDRGVVVDLKDQYLDGTGRTDILPKRYRCAWAPAMRKRDGKYYLYFSGGYAEAGDPGGQSNVAISDRADGDFVLQSVMVSESIDPAVFEDPQTGKWYYTWGQSGIMYAELNDDMVSYDNSTLYKSNAASGFREGSYLHARKDANGKWWYYFTYSMNDTNEDTYLLRYCTAESMEGPWTYRGQILYKDDDKGILGTGHHSVLQVPGTDDWYAVYHCFLTDEMRPRLNDILSPGATSYDYGSQLRTGNKRETRIARMTYTEPTDRTVPLINPIEVTYEGVRPEKAPKVSITGTEKDGTAGVDMKLTAEMNETWEGISWQWYRDGNAISGANHKEYTLQKADEACKITVKAVAQSTSGVTQNGGEELSMTDTLTSQSVNVKKVGSLVIKCDGFVYNGTTIATPTVVSTTNTGKTASFRYYSDSACTKEIAGSIVNAGTYYVVGTIASTNTYAAVQAVTSFTIAKATPAYTKPTGLTAVYGSTLATIKLPKGFAFEAALTTSVGSVGTRVFKVKYTPTDTANYNVISGINVNVKVVNAVPARNKVYSKGNLKYKVTKSAKTGGTVEVKAPAKKNLTSYSVPATVKINGYTFKVTGIASNAFKGNKKLTRITIGKNVKAIGKNALQGCSNLKTISVKTKVLTKVGSNALKGINSKAVITVPKAKKTKYTKLFKGKGQKNSVEIK